MDNLHRPSKWPRTVGIVGGGVAGLYTALLLRKYRPDIKYRIFEGTNRVGGRVQTHFFQTVDDYQYFEAGAMRIPKMKSQEITLDLVNYVKAEQKSIGLQRPVEVERIDYNITSEGNIANVNGVRVSSTIKASEITPNDVNWVLNSPDEKIWGDVRAGHIIKMAIGRYQDELERAAEKGPDEFEKAFLRIVTVWDDYSFRHFLKIDRSKVDSLPTPTSAPGVNPGNIPGLPTPGNFQIPDTIIDFLETVTSQTNQFALSVPELIMQNLDFGVENWWTIDKGMSRLPEAMTRLVELKNITFGARVTAITPVHNKNDQLTQVKITASGYNGTLNACFDAIVLAIPPAALKMIVSRPTWSPEKEMAIRSIHFESLYKMGLRFKTRFWETTRDIGTEEVPPSKGGQSTTDFPIRWIIYPSYDIGGTGPGVLLVYAWMTDATTWLPLTAIERRQLALENLKRVYGPTARYGGGEVPLEELLIESADAVWSQSTATGDAMFLPGQFNSRFEAARTPEVLNSDGKHIVYFAGEHISYHHTWIAGALDSALWTTRKLLDNQTLTSLRPPQDLNSNGLPVDEPVKPATVNADENHIEFVFAPNDPLHFRYAHGDTGGPGGDKTSNIPQFPLSLGDGSGHGIGAEICRLQGPYAGPFSGV